MCTAPAEQLQRAAAVGGLDCQCRQLPGIHRRRCRNARVWRVQLHVLGLYNTKGVVTLITSHNCMFVGYFLFPVIHRLGNAPVQRVQLHIWGLGSLKEVWVFNHLLDSTWRK